MMRRERTFGLAVMAGAVAVLASACGGGGGSTGGAAPTPTVSVGIQGASWVAFQDGANGNWTTLASNGGFSGTVSSNAPDGRYSLAFVCPGQKPTVQVVHATRQELPQLNFTCSAQTPPTITANGTVSELNGGTALISIGETTTTSSGAYSLLLVPGTYDVIAVRVTGSVPNRVWLQRNRQFSNDTTYPINFEQPDGTVVRVFDVSDGALTVSGLDTQVNETATVRVLLQSGNRTSAVGLGSALNNLTPIAYPLFPSGVLGAAELFQVRVDTSEQRSVVQVAPTLPNSLTISLPPVYGTPTLSVTSTGAIQFSAQDFSYSETPVVGYQLSTQAISGARYEYLITRGWLGSTNTYTTPVLETLSEWDPTWSLQRGEVADVALRIYVSPSGATPQQLWNYLQGNPLSSGFTLRYAARRQTLNL